ncbi:hypothetical protein GCM10009665_17240 [Kitasatospora nipponensis]|uniref:Uncharacterized protein n=1 Tax=Kitasatospora nipponensis TaxID=258049 RepID=A0ABN1VZD3_9ACTN
MRHVSAFRVVVVAMALGLAACGAAEDPRQNPASPSGPHATGSVSAAGQADPVRAAPDQAAPAAPAPSRRSVLDWAEQNSQMPADGALTVVDWQGTGPAALLWQAAGSQDVCMAQTSAGTGLVVSCEKSGDIVAAGSPALKAVMVTTPLRESRPADGVVFFASGETVDRLSCRQSVSEAHTIMDVEVGGEPRTFFWASVPHELGGTYGADVRRGGLPSRDTVRVYAEGTVDC